MLVEINELFCSKPDEPPFDYEQVSFFFVTFICALKITIQITTTPS